MLSSHKKLKNAASSRFTTPQQTSVCLRRSFQLLFILVTAMVLAACGGGGGGGGDSASSTTPGSGSNPVTEPTPTTPSAMARNAEFLIGYFDQMLFDRPDFQYGVYASRTLLNPNIHIYLHADKTIIEDLEQLDGSQELYQLSPSQLTPTRETQLSTTQSIDLQDIDVLAKPLISSRDLYPAEYPYLSFFDDRLQNSGFTLKAASVTEVERAALVYLKILTGLEKGETFAQYQSEETLALVYTQDEHAYISSGTALYTVSGTQIPVSEIGPVQFVANTEETWYPHYDTSLESNSALTSTVNLILASQPVASLPLSETEATLAQALKTLKTDPLRSAEALRYRQLVTAMFTSNVILPSDRLASHQDLYGSDSDAIYRDTYSAYLEALLHASMLSPIADYLSHFVGQSQFTTEFRVSPNLSASVWGTAYSMHTIDQGWRANVGNCVHKALFTAAALEIAGHDWNRVRSWGHDHIYDATDGAIYNNGMYNAPSGNVMVAKSQIWNYETYGLYGVQTIDGWWHAHIAGSSLFQVG